MTERAKLGIHSDVPFDAKETSGHGWLSVTKDGITETYGSWPSNSRYVHRHGKSDGWTDQGTDIQKDIELATGLKPIHSHYFELTPEQEKILEQKLNEPHTWKKQDNCASWAARTAGQVTGKDISAQDIVRLKDGSPFLLNGEPMKTDCPRGLSKSIASLEREKKERETLSEKAPATEGRDQPEKKSPLYWNKSSSRDKAEDKSRSQTDEAGSKLHWNRSDPDRDKSDRSR